MGRERGGQIIMTSVTMQKQISLSFNNIKVTTQLKKGSDQDFSFKQKDYYLKLETKLNELSLQVLEQLIGSINHLLMKLKQEDKKSQELYIAIDRVKNMATWYRTKGVNKLLELIEEIKSRKISQDDYEYLISVIENQEQFAIDLFERDLSINRIQSIVNFIGDFVFYLEMDLALESLPNSISEPEVELVPKKFYNTNYTNFYSYKEPIYKHTA
ncbi:MULTISPECIES: hypothetical protein [Bacillus cereus group]|uniref:hypothetical protein n=1 Tax=Bacillus cereus group TaxID=86661 RepID=UPI00350E3C72